MRHLAVMFVLLGVVAGAAMPAYSQGPPDAAARAQAQREAMAALDFMDGVWRGQAWTLLPSGEKHIIVQTERIGPFLDGTVKVMEGRGYEPDGSVSFNAFGIISFEPSSQVYSLRSYAMSVAGDFVVTPSGNGYTWEIPAGPATIRYTATVADDAWHEVGDRIVPGQAPMRFFEMTLARVGDTDWPGANPVSPD